ncbi:MAG TPA: hypothetical protein VNO21_10105, partial [Polyangiaceae bacterium]|nr:hypothetical protein [Polyangiaceae bacterium]
HQRTSPQSENALARAESSRHGIDHASLWRSHRAGGIADPRIGTVCVFPCNSMKVAAVLLESVA